jgi:hypothetical protein
MMQFSVDGDKAVGHEREIASVVAPLCTLQDRLAESHGTVKGRSR